MARTAEDLATVLQHIAGSDPLDATSSAKPVDDYLSGLTTKIKGKKIGLPKEYFNDQLSAEIKKIIDQVIAQLKELGAEIVEVSLPSTGFQIPGYYLIALSETSSNLARFDGIRYGDARENFTEETIRRIILGTHALSAGYSDELYKKAQKLRTKFIQEYAQAFQQCDVMLTPIVAGEPAKIGELINDPVRNLLEDLYTVTVNLVGVPSLALPAGFTKNKLPVGFQLIGKHFHEAELLNIGHQYQQITNWHHQVPDLIN
jgi:aspartyl-tRNA(Asn)/glutamyl-tRNA(Gln) amidotransferase subunit A